jgi:hypothetical protein
MMAINKFYWDLLRERGPDWAEMEDLTVNLKK